MTEEKLEYLVPRRIQLGFQFAAGWGKREMGAVLVGAGVGCVVGLILYLLHHLGWAVFTALAGIALGVAVARPMPDGSTGLDILQAQWESLKRQRLYLYDWSRDDW